MSGSHISRGLAEVRVIIMILRLGVRLDHDHDYYTLWQITGITRSPFRRRQGRQRLIWRRVAAGPGGHRHGDCSGPAGHRDAGGTVTGTPGRGRDSGSTVTQVQQDSENVAEIADCHGNLSRHGNLMCNNM